MQVRYYNSRLDLLISNLHFSFTSKAIWLMAVIIMGLVFATMDFPEDTVAQIALLFAYLLFCLVYVLFCAFVGFLFLAIPGTRVISDEHTVELTEDSLIESTSSNRSEQSWNSILGVRCLLNRTIIYVGPMHAHVVPGRAFENEEQRKKFLEMCVRYMKKTA